LFDRPKPTAGCSANGRRRKGEEFEGKGGEEVEEEVYCLQHKNAQHISLQWVPREFSIFVKGKHLLNNPSQQTLFKLTKQTKKIKPN